MELRPSSRTTRPIVGEGRIKTQTVVDARSRLAKLLSTEGLPDMELTPEDVRLIAHIRAVGYGEMHITITSGKPAKATFVQDSIDYTKPVKII